MKQLREQIKSPVTTSWPSVVLITTKLKVRSGLQEELQTFLLTKYEPQNDLSFLVPPKINKKIIPKLGATVITRDKHLVQNWTQVGVSLNAFPSGFAKLSRLECVQTSTKTRAAVSKIAGGIHLLADHHFRLSQIRQAFIVPSLNILGKTASDSAPIDDCLFDTNFADEVNAAQSIEKVARKMVKKTCTTDKFAGPKPHPMKQRNTLPARHTSNKQENRRSSPRKSSAAQQTRRVHA